MAGLPGNNGGNLNEGIKNRLPISNIFDFQTNISHLKGIPLKNHLRKLCLRNWGKTANCVNCVIAMNPVPVDT